MRLDNCVCYVAYTPTHGPVYPPPTSVFYTYTISFGWAADENDYFFVLGSEE